MRKLIIAFLSVSSLSAVAGPAMPVPGMSPIPSERIVAGDYTELQYPAKLDTVEVNGRKVQKYLVEKLLTGTIIREIGGDCQSETRTLVGWEQNSDGTKHPTVKVHIETVPCPKAGGMVDHAADHAAPNSW